MANEQPQQQYAISVVVSVRDSVVDIRFDAHLPPIYSLLRAQEGEIAITVLAQLDAPRVGGIALAPTKGFARGEYNAAMERPMPDITVLIASDRAEAQSSLRNSEAG